MNEQKIPEQDKDKMRQLNRVSQLFVDTICTTFDTNDVVISFGYILPNGLIASGCVVAPKAQNIDMIIFQMTWSIYNTINNKGLESI